LAGLGLHKHSNIHIPYHFCIKKAVKISYLKSLMMYTWNKTEMQAKASIKAAEK
jgi:hypothetical protein